MHSAYCFVNHEGGTNPVSFRVLHNDQEIVPWTVLGTDDAWLLNVRVPR